MRLLLICLAIPFFTKAQINRSATELAQERVKDYIETKLFKDLPYKAISYGELRPCSQPHSQTTWSITHKFEMEDPVFSDKKTAATKSYYFSFYLDKKLKVLLAESFMRY